MRIPEELHKEEVHKEEVHKLEVPPERIHRAHQYERVYPIVWFPGRTSRSENKVQSPARTPDSKGWPFRRYLRIPKDGHSAAISGGEGLSIRNHRKSPNRFLVPFERGQELSVGQRPQLNGVV